MTDPSSSSCPFCQRVQQGDVSVESELAAAFPDGFPISPGHMLIIPKRHEADFFNLTHEEQTALLELTRYTRQELVATTDATAFNIGVNAGPDAGQTVSHAHVHLVPRYAGDVADPRGGIRWIIPDKAAYWET